MSTKSNDFSHLALKALSQVRISIIRPKILSTIPQKIRTFAQARFSLDDPQIIYIFCLFAITTAFVSVGFILRKKSRSALSVSLARDPRLSDLNAFIVPVRSSKQNPQLVSFTSHGMTIDLSTFLEGINSGSIELRNPQDLQAVFRDQFNVGNSKISLRVGHAWKMKIAKWIVGSYADVTTTNYPADRPVWSLILDSVPRSDIEATLSRFLASLARGTRAKIVFTAKDPSIRFVSQSFLFCALPFISTSKRATPLSLALDEIIPCIARATHVRILSITNASERYAVSLYELDRDLVEDTEVRTRSIKRWGAQHWREERLMIVWEAGLHAAGLLNRWVVVVEK